jgi:hypothetical protein
VFPANKNHKIIIKFSLEETDKNENAEKTDFRETINSIGSSGITNSKQKKIIICLLCRKKFVSEEDLANHENRSDNHKVSIFSITLKTFIYKKSFFNF